MSLDLQNLYKQQQDPKNWPAASPTPAASPANDAPRVMEVYKGWELIRHNPYHRKTVFAVGYTGPTYDARHIATGKTIPSKGGSLTNMDLSPDRNNPAYKVSPVVALRKLVDEHEQKELEQVTEAAKEKQKAEGPNITPLVLGGVGAMALLLLLR